MKKATTTEPASKSTRKAPAKRVSSAVASAPKKVVDAVPVPPASVPTTVVVARIDVGFGNLLYIRGEGPGLSWERGVPMECASSDTWTWSTAAASRPFAYKVLINDERWSLGDDFVAVVGAENAVSPSF